jgi:hypothetical protein
MAAGISADLSKGLVDGPNSESWDGWNLFRNKHLLHSAACSQLSRQPLLFTPVANQVGLRAQCTAGAEQCEHPDEQEDLSHAVAT